MDADISANGSCKGEISSQQFLSIVRKSKECYESPEVEIVRQLPQLSTKPSDPLGPVTPEGGDNLNGCSSPVSSLPRSLSFNSQQYVDLIYSNKESPRTPEDSVFDSFAPGPCDVMLAPQCKKYFVDSRTKVTRHLNFEESLNVVENIDHKAVVTTSEDEMLVETLYNILLEVITSNQMEGLHAKASSPLSDPDGYKTPTSIPHLSGVADTCPDAPRKPTNRFKNIDKGLCKKLVF